MVVAASLGVVGACGDDDEGLVPEADRGESPDDSTDGAGDSDSGDGSDLGDYIDATVRTMDPASMGLDDTEAACLASTFVDLYGVDALQEAGITPEEFAGADSPTALGLDIPRDAEERMGEAIADCDGVVEAMEDEMVGAFPSEFGIELPDEAAECLRSNLDDELVADTLATSILDPENAAVDTMLLPTIGACPDVAIAVLTGLLQQQEGVTVTPEVEQCVRDFVDDNAERVGEAFGSGDQAEGESLGVDLGVACAGVIGG